MSTIKSEPSTEHQVNRSAPYILVKTIWALFISSSLFFGWYVFYGSPVSVGNIITIDGLTAVMWVAVTFFSGIVHSYSYRYMSADPGVDRFFYSLSLVTLSVATMTAADHIALFVISWGAMGWFMSNLIGHARGWEQAQEAGSYARWSFLAGTGLITLSLLLLWQQTGESTISGIVSSLEGVLGVQALAGILLIIAAMIQSSLFPFHRWLLSSMTAPTPASAIMHAGFVNAGGILLTRFAPVFTQTPGLMSFIAITGAVSAVLAHICMLAQPDIKTRLGCSTIAQMGFMILQCGLGFFAAAIAHLIIHGFYKASQFLSCGMRVEQINPSADSSYSRKMSNVFKIPVAIITAAGSGILFAALTGKDVASLNTGLFLTIIVAVSGLHATNTLLNSNKIAPVARAIGVPLLMLPTISIYAFIYNSISAAMYSLPMVSTKLELTAVHWAALAVFVLTHLALLLGWHKKSHRLYALAINIAQPVSETVLVNKGDYNEF